MENNEQNSSRGITLADIFRVIKKNWILIAVITAVVLIAGMIYTFAIVKPTYSSTSSVVVVVPTDKTKEVGADGNSVDVTSSRNITYTIVDTVKKTSILESVAAKHNLTYAQLRNMVSASTNNNSFLINITVTSTNKELTRDLANEIAEKLISEASETTTDNTTALFYAKGYIAQVDKAQIGAYASPNKTLYIIVSILGGLVLALVVVFIKEFASTKFVALDEVKTLGYPILNTLVDDKSKEKSDESLIEPSIRNFEPYNRLISNIKFANVDNPFKTVMFTSTMMDELKTTTCSNFAFTLANNEKKVIIVDLDLRKPRVHKTFGVSRENGIVDYLDDSITKEELIKHSDKNVDIITVGKNVSNPISLLESAKLKELLEDLKKDYDYVAIDTPPLMACNDASIISSLVDGVVFNVAMNQAKKKEIKAAIEQLIDSKANIIGLNITKAKMEDRGGYYYYYYQNYGDTK